MPALLSAAFGHGRAGDRPMIFTALFWVGVIAPLAVRVVGPADDHKTGFVPLALCAIALVALWLRLGWSPTTDARGPVVFVVLASLYGTLDGSGTSLPLLWIALAAVALTLGTRAMAIAGAAMVAWMFATMLGWFGRDLTNATIQAAGAGVVLLFFAALADAIAGERRERRRVHGLLDELRASNAALVRSNETVRHLAVAEERARLAQEVHDAVGHHLTVVKLGLTNAQRLKSRDADAAWQAVDEARNAAGTALAEVRRAVRAMGPAPLDSANLGTALKTLVSSYGTGSLDVRLDVTGHVDRLPADAEATLYRVCEEALTNVHRHACGATAARVELAYAREGVRLMVTDDGRPTAAPIEGFGLAGARQRLDAVGGTLTVATEPGGGVRLRAFVPAAPQGARP